MSDQRDRSIEILLRQREDDADAASTDRCVDAESLAAWMDGAISAEARAAYEKHAAECARCQALLASMARTEPEIEARPWWRSVTAKWLIPVAATATALGIWISAGQGPVPSPAVPAPPVQTSRDESPPRPEGQASAADSASPGGMGGSSNKQPARVSQPADRVERSSGELGRRDGSKTDGGVTAGGEPKRSAEPMPVVGGIAGTSRDALPPAPPPSPAGPPSPFKTNELSAAQARAASPAAANEAVTVSPRAAAASPFGGRGGSGGGIAALPIEIQSPDPNHRWRVVPPSGIQRSTDGGTTWTIVDPLASSLRDSGGTAGVVLIAGSSPARDVCWIVGRAGVVLLSTDGATWQRRPFPQSIDLAGVRASSATTAVVTAADGRQLATSDAGATWAVVK